MNRHPDAPMGISGNGEIGRHVYLLATNIERDCQAEFIEAPHCGYGA
jgi:hypothetical protein